MIGGIGQTRTAPWALRRQSGVKSRSSSGCWRNGENATSRLGDPEWFARRWLSRGGSVVRIPSAGKSEKRTQIQQSEIPNSFAPAGQ